MRKCQFCGVELIDPVKVCPLCHCVAVDIPLKDGEKKEDPEPAYPYADRKRKRGVRILSIYSVSAIAAALILVWIGIILNNYYWWTLMVILGLAYGYVTLRFSIRFPIAYKAKTMMQSLLAFLLVLFIDSATGFYGWSLDYVYPGMLLLLELAVIVMMLLNKTNFQSYMPMEMILIVLSLVPFIEHRFGLFRPMMIGYGTLTVTLLVFAATLILGGKRAKDELYRRFHV